MSRKSNYDKFPSVQVPGAAGACSCGWEAIGARLQEAVRARAAGRTIVVMECYTGVDEQQVMSELILALQPTASIHASDAMLSPREIDQLIAPFLGGDDPVFGFLCGLKLPQFFDQSALNQLRARVQGISSGIVLIVGCGASLIAEPDMLIYADLARWEAQNRFRRSQASNLGADNASSAASLQYK